MKVFQIKEKAIVTRNVFIKAKTKEDAISQWENGTEYLAFNEWEDPEDAELEIDGIEEI